MEKVETLFDLMKQIKPFLTEITILRLEFDVSLNELQQNKASEIDTIIVELLQNNTKIIV